VQAGWSIMTEQDTEGRRTYYTGSSSQNNNGTEGANFFLFNHRGDTVLITDQTGEVSNELYYEAYGKVTDNTGTPISAETIPTLTPLPPLFVGAYGIRYDRKTELSYMRFRWYDCGIMRFISFDLLKAVNRYSYSIENPITFSDVNGLFPVFNGDPRQQQLLQNSYGFIQQNAPPIIQGMIGDLMNNTDIHFNVSPPNKNNWRLSAEQKVDKGRWQTMRICPVYYEIKNYAGSERYDKAYLLENALGTVHEITHAWEDFQDAKRFLKDLQANPNLITLLDSGAIGDYSLMDEVLSFTMEYYYMAHLYHINDPKINSLINSSLGLSDYNSYLSSVFGNNYRQVLIKMSEAEIYRKLTSPPVLKKLSKRIKQYDDFKNLQNNCKNGTPFPGLTEFVNTLRHFSLGI
jgi:RHS repeat-associated protein